MDIVKRLVTDFGDSFLVIVICGSVLVAVLFVLCWLITKRRLNRTKHQVPAGVIKDYLDTVIQNSTSLRSALFREAGVGRNSSVLPVYKLDGKDKGSAASVEQGGSGEISVLREELLQKEQVINDLTNKLQSSQGQQRNTSQQEGEVQRLTDEIAQLKNQLVPFQEAAKERDELKAKLPQYETGQSEESLASSDQSLDKSSEESSKGKSTEDLLDEFEKMLG